MQDSFRKPTTRSSILIQGVVDGALFDWSKIKKAKTIFVMEGRPRLEAARYVCRQLQKRKMIPTLIADNMAGFLFYRGWVREIWMACQVKERGGYLCDAGALILGVLGKRHNVPVHLYPAKRTTDFLSSQKDILNFNGVPITPRGVKGYAPLVDWVPERYVSWVYQIL